MRTFLLSFAAAAGLATSALAATEAPITLTADGIVSSGGYLSGYESSATTWSIYGGLDTVDTGYSALFPYYGGVNEGLYLYGNLALAGTVKGQQRFTGTLNAWIAGLVDVSSATLFSPFGGALAFSDDGTWSCSGDCDLKIFDTEAYDFVDSGETLTTGTYSMAALGGDTDTPAPVPLPATASLMGLGLAGLAALRRRRKTA